MNVFKVSKSFSEPSSTRPRKDDGRTTRRSRDMELEVQKLNFFGYSEDLNGLFDRKSKIFHLVVIHEIVVMMQEKP